MIRIGMDIALRSNGIVAINDDNEIVGLRLLETFKNDKHLTKKQKHMDIIIANEEDIIIYNQLLVYGFIKHLRDFEGYTNIEIHMEGLSYNSESASKDILAGMHWSIRSMIVHDFDIKPIILPPEKWRKGIIKGLDRINYLNKYPEQATDLTKFIPYMKIDNKNKNVIDSYYNNHGIHDKGYFDLSDAFWIAMKKV